MVSPAPLIITPDVVASLHRLRDFAASRPVDITWLAEKIKDPEIKRAHLKRMAARTIRIDGPFPFFVTFSIQTGHPAGTCRHMSMSIKREGRAPSHAAVWMVAEELGFAGGLTACQCWMEELNDGFGWSAVNVAQPIAVQDTAQDESRPL
jgi:hypothetical protein